MSCMPYLAWLLCEETWLIDWLICCSSCPKKTRQDFTTEQKQLLRNLTHCKWRCAHSPSTSGIVCNSTHHCAVSICNISVYFRVVMKQHFTWTHKFVLFKKKKTAMVASTSNLYLCIKVCLNTWLYLLCKISPSLYSDACRSVCWFSFFRGGGSRTTPHHTTPHHILQHEFIDSELMCITAIRKAAHFDPLTTIVVDWTVSRMGRLVLISTVCITLDKAFINEMLPSGLNTGFLSGTSVNYGQLNVWFLMFRPYFCTILTHDNKINT